MSREMENKDHLEVGPLEVTCLMGFAKQERVQPQKILVHFKLYMDPKPSALSGELNDSVDYVRVLGETKFILESGEFILIETAAEAIASHLLMHPLITRAAVKITKPEVVIHSASPSLFIDRSKESFAGIQDTKQYSWGRVETLFASADRSLHRLVIKPGKTVVLKDLSQRQCRDLVLSSGEAFTWAPKVKRSYKNTFENELDILTISHDPDNFFSTILEEESDVSTQPLLSLDYFLGIPSRYLF